MNKDEKQLREVVTFTVPAHETECICARCENDYSLDSGKEYSTVCHDCAHLIAEKAIEVVPMLLDELERLRAALTWIADPARELEAKKSVMLSGPFGPAKTIREMQERAREAMVRR